MTWADPAYGHRKTITVDYTKVTANLVDFPMLILVTDADLKHTTHSGYVTSLSGFDICFYTSNDVTLLKHELVTYVHDTGAVEVWVKIPALSNSVNTVINMYYGNSSITTTQNSTDTWDSNYKMVQHLNDTTTSTSTTSDSTSNAVGGTKKGANEPIEATGKIGKAQDFDGSNDYIGYGTGLIMSGAGTISFWIYYQNAGDFSSREIIIKREGAPGYAKTNYQFCYQLSPPPHTGKFEFYNGVTQLDSGWLTTDTWSYVTIMRTGTNEIKLYVDGSLYYTFAKDWGTTGNAETVYTGGHPTLGGYYCDMKLDELRVSNSTRTTTWISTEYANQNSPSTFMAFGIDQVGPTGWTKSLPETLTISDSFARNAVYKRTVSDTTTLSDLFEYLREYPLSDNITFSDLLNFEYDYHNLETLGISDIFSRTVDFDRILSNTETLSDLISKEPGKELTETVTLSDNLVKLSHWKRAIDETLSITDDLDALIYFNRLLSETVAIVDDFDREMTYIRTVDEPFPVWDLIKFSNAFKLVFPETLTISDSIITTIYTTWLKTLSSNVALSDLCRTKTAFNRTLTNTLALSDLFTRQVNYKRDISELLALHEFKVTLHNIGYLVSIYDNLNVIDAENILKNQNMLLSETLALIDSLNPLTTHDMMITDVNGVILLYLHRPYMDNADGSLDFNSIAFSFRSGNYTAYIDDLSDEKITLVGYENAADVLTRFEILSGIADDGTEIIINFLNSEWTATYIIESFSYKPISLDVFEYKLSLKLVRL